jgi:uncharacterized membrane protein
VKIYKKTTPALLFGSLAALYLLDDNRAILIENSSSYGHAADVGISILELVILALWFGVTWKEVSAKIYRTIAPLGAEALDNSTRGISEAIAAFCVGGMILIGFLLRYDFIAHQEANGSDPTGKYLGTLGDFFGGVLNPILTFFTLIALVLTVVMQRMQLRDTKVEVEENSRLARLQTFETTFFNLINLHTTTVQELRLARGQITATIFAVYKSGNPNARPTQSSDSKYSNDITGRAVFSEVIHNLQLSLQNAHPTPVKAYSIIQKQHNHVLGKYFRNLYQILEFIDEFSGRYIADPQKPSAIPGKRYADILRAQLSTDELILLFYNCVGKMVDDGEFREKVKKYELLEHMSLEYSDKRIRIANFNADISSEINEYFYYVDDRLESPGAFGRNGSIEAYLIEAAGYVPLNRAQTLESP